MFGMVRADYPAISCGDARSVPRGLQDSCQDILDTMLATMYYTTFGPSSDPLALVHTPYTLTSGTSSLNHSKSLV